MALISCFRVFFVLSILSSILIYRIHNGAPHHLTSCTLLAINCPKIKEGGPIYGGNNKFISLQNTLKSFVETGQDIASQICIYVDNKNELDYFVADSNRFPNYNSSSLTTIFSSTKNIAALLMAVAVDNGWINSYNDKVIDYWHAFPIKSQIVYLNNDNNTGEQIYKFEPIKELKYITIADVLRHDSGLCIFWDHKHDIYYNTSNKQTVTTYAKVKQYIENSKLTYISNELNENNTMSYRCYHATTRGYILNEIFKLVEPKHRYMNEYYKQEIATENNIFFSKDKIFKMYFKGIDNDIDRNNFHHIQEINKLWMIYHFIIPFITSYTNYLPTSFCYDYILNKSLCQPFDIEFIKKFGRVKWKMSQTDITEDTHYGSSKFYAHEMSMEHMSTSGITNAHSMTKLLSAYLFDESYKNKLKNEVINSLISNATYSVEAYYTLPMNVTQGGFGYMNHFQGIDVFYWGGWGGSYYAFIPKYKCVISYVVVGTTRLDPWSVRETIVIESLINTLKKHF